MWLDKGKEITSIEQMPRDVYGFVYMITCQGSYYIGKKKLTSKRKRRFGKKEIARLKDKRLKTWEYVVKESDWLKYTGSNKELNNLVKAGCMNQKYILQYAFNAKELTYLEMKHQVIRDVLRDESCFNDNILGKFFADDFSI